MPRFKMTVEYHGGKFAGWQVQPSLRTVQGQLQKCLRWILNKDTPVTGAGRTDTGVHALGQVAHFDTDAVIPLTFADRLNSALPDDICVLSIDDVAPDFHARFSAIQKTYYYKLTLYPSAFAGGLAWTVLDKLDWPALEDATARLEGDKDCSGFCRVGSLKDDATCSIKSITWQRNEREAMLEITADRFLHRMVRLIVGTLIDIGRGNHSPDHIDKIIESRNVRLAAQAAPAEGLYLAHVEYP